MFRSRKVPRKFVGRGMVAAQVAISMVPLLGVAGFAVDGGMMYEYARRVQAAADAVALAAAGDLYQNYFTNSGVDVGGTAKASATSTATANGFSTSNNSTLTVNIPPQSGPFAGKAGYAEVILVYDMPRGFSSVVASGAVPIQARSVARGLKQSSNAALLILDPTGSGAFNDQGGASVTVTGGNIVVNSTSASGATASGSASITAPKLIFSGSPGYSTSGGANITGTIVSGASPTADPLASLAAPSMSSLTVQGTNFSLSRSQTATLNPGIYNGGITLIGNSSAVLNPGIYYLNGGGLTVSNGASLTADGVMFYNDPGSSGSIDIAGAGVVTISPPTSGTYQGISLFQNRTATAQVTIANGTLSNITGTIYAAAALVSVSGGSSLNSVGSQFIAKDLTVAGSGAVAVINSPGSTPYTRLYGLVE